MTDITKWQDKILKLLAGRLEGYLLGGGTALSKVYFRHRSSLDLDFFTPDFSRKDIFVKMEYLSGQLRKRFELVQESKGKGMLKVLIFRVHLLKSEWMKIDFIEDYIGPLKPPRQINGIWVFSLEDIYLRKICAVSGTIFNDDDIGRTIAAGTRQEAKDFYDLYFLSHTFMNLSEFAFKYCKSVTQEGLIRWFRTYSRMEMRTELLELRTKNKIYYQDMERHFKREIDRLLERLIAA